MSLIENIKQVFRRGTRLEDVDVDELTREKVRVEQIERRISREFDRTEGQKEQLFRRGTDRTGRRWRTMLARKIKQLDRRARAKEQQLALLSRHLRIIDGLLRVKENLATLRQLELGSVISAMPLSDLTEYVEKASVEGQFEMEKFARLVGVLDGTLDAEDYEDEADVEEIVAAMEEARAAEEDGQPAELSSAFNRVNRVLRERRVPEAREMETGAPVS